MSKDSRGRSMASAKAGRAALSKNRGRGVQLQSHKNGRGAGGLLNYMLDKQESEIVFTNTGGTKELALDDFKSAAQMRPDIQNTVGHISCSLPPTTRVDSATWDHMSFFIVDKLDLSKHALVAVRHRDQDHDHIHLAYSRISDDGEVFDDRFLKLRLASIEDEIEDHFSLPLTPNPETPVPNYTQGEAAKAIRDSVKPSRLVVADSIYRVLQENKPKNIEQFIDYMREFDIEAIPNISKSGKMSGFKFILDGDAFKGSDVGAKWAQLSKELEKNEHDRTDLQTADEAGIRIPSAGQVAQGAGSHVGRSSETPRRDSQKGTTSPRSEARTKAPAGFCDIQDMGDSRGDWIERESHFVRRGRVRKSHSDRFKRPAFFVSGSASAPARPVAFGRNDGGIAIPKHQQLDDQQLAEMIQLAVQNGESGKLELNGSDAFKDRCARFADQLGIEHDHHPVVMDSKKKRQPEPVHKDEDVDRSAPAMKP